jgi:hypothetical protein
MIFKKELATQVVSVKILNKEGKRTANNGK